MAEENHSQSLNALAVKLEGIGGKVAALQALFDEREKCEHRALALIGEVNETRFHGMEERQALILSKLDIGAGRGQGANFLWNLIAAILGLLIGAAGIMVLLYHKP